MYHYDKAYSGSLVFKRQLQLWFQLSPLQSPLDMPSLHVNGAPLEKTSPKFSCVKDAVTLATEPTHLQYMHHKTCAMTPCINALPLSHSIIQQTSWKGRNVVLRPDI